MARRSAANIMPCITPKGIARVTCASATSPHMPQRHRQTRGLAGRAGGRHRRAMRLRTLPALAFRAQGMGGIKQEGDAATATPVTIVFRVMILLALFTAALNSFRRLSMATPSIVTSCGKRTRAIVPSSITRALFLRSAAARKTSSLFSCLPTPGT